MRTIMIALLTLLIGLQTADAQGRKEQRNERINAFRIAIFTEVLELSAEEAQVFWPLYNEMQDKMDAFKKEKRREKADLDKLTDKEIEAFINQHLEREQRELDLKKEYITKFKKVLPLRKVAKIPMAERQFRETLLKEMAERRKKRE